MNKIKLLLLITACMLSFISCEQNIKKRVNCICFIDYSASLSEETLENYIHTISYDLITNLDQHDRIIVLPVDEGAKLEPTKLIYEDFSKKSFGKPTDGFTHAQDSIKKRILGYINKRAPNIEIILKGQKKIRKKYVNQTNLLGAIEQTKIFLETNEEDGFFKGLGRFLTGKNKIDTENILVLFSDMINESEDCNFQKISNLNENEINRILNKLRSEDKIPDLTSIKVFIHGRTGRTNLQVERIQKFWEKYFQLTGGKLMAYNFDVGNEITDYLRKTRVSE